MKFTIKEYLEKLPLPANNVWEDGIYFTTALKQKNVSLEFFAPRGTDYQTLHEEDEFYFIVRGSGNLIIADERFCLRSRRLFFCSRKNFAPF
jgi:mannose-6-phosphate isomerase-like protein (cupin superfamily)